MIVSVDTFILFRNLTEIPQSNENLIDTLSTGASQQIVAWELPGDAYVSYIELNPRYSSTVQQFNSSTVYLFK